MNLPVLRSSSHRIASLPIVNSDEPAVDVDQHALEHFVHVVRLARDVLVVPADLSGLGIDGERAVRVERVAVGAARNRAHGLACAVHQ